MSPSLLYATAACLEGCSFVNGGSQNTLCGALEELAAAHRCYVLGTDFKVCGWVGRWGGWGAGGRSATQTLYNMIQEPPITPPTPTDPPIRSLKKVTNPQLPKHHSQAGQTKFKTAAVEYVRALGLKPTVIASSNHLGA